MDRFMDRLLYNAAVRGYKNLPTAIADDNEHEDDSDDGDNNEHEDDSDAGDHNEDEDDYDSDDGDHIEDEDDYDSVDDNDDEDEWRNLKVDEEYYTRKTRGKNNILHLSVQLEHLTLAEKAARRFPQLISEVNADGNNSLHVAAEIGDTDFVKLLVDSFQKMIIRDDQIPPWKGKNKEGNTPLHVALIYGKIKLACYLVELDPSLAFICNNSEEIPLHLALRHRVDNDREMVKDAMKLVTKHKKKGCCKLEKNSMPIMKLLLKKEPSMAYWRDKEGLTPPLLAATFNPPYVQAIHGILKYCPESLEECDCFGNTVLHLMTPLSNEINMDASKVLMRLFSFSQISALKNKRNNDGNTPVHIAIKNNNVELIAILIKSSANLAIKNKTGVSAENLIQQYSKEFQTIVKNKIEFMDNKESPRRKYDISPEEIYKIGFSIESIKEKKMLHKTTYHGNILHTLTYPYPDKMEDNEVKEFIKELLRMAPKLICQLNHWGHTALHHIAKDRPCLIDKNFRKMIKDFYKLSQEEEDVEKFWYNPPWAVKNKYGDTILHFALSYNLPGPWLDEILKFDYDFAKQVNNAGELPLHVLLKRVFHPYYKRTYAEKVGSGLACDIIHCVNSLNTYNDRASHITDNEGLTPLFIAAQAKEFGCFNLLLEQHALLHVYGDIENCDLKSTYDGDPDGNTFWHHLAHVHDDAVLFDDICDDCTNACNALTQCNKSGKTPFHIAIENGNFKVAMYFSKFLPDDERHLVYKNMGDKDGNVLLHLVVGQSNLPSAQEFIQDVTTPTELIAVHNNMGLTPLHVAVLKQDHQFLDILFDLKRDDEEFTRQILQITDRDHNTPLHYAISQGAFAFVDMFFDKGVSAECIDEILGMSNKDGNGPLHLSVLRGDSSRATKFIIRGATENNFIQGMLDKHNNEGNTALHLAVLKGNQAIVKIFIKTMKENSHFQGILGKCDNEGNTPIHLAIQTQQFNLVKDLIEYTIESSCIDKILSIPNNKDETAISLIGSATNLPIEFEKFIWNKSKVVKAMLGIRSLRGAPPKMIKEYTNMIGVIAALLATITFTAGFAVPGGLKSSDGTPLLMHNPAFQVFMVSDIIAMCLSLMVLFVVTWFMTIDNVKHQMKLLDLIVFLLQGAIYATLLTFMTGLYATVFPSTHWIAIFACVLCSLIILLIPSFNHIYVRYQKLCSPIKRLDGLICCCRNNNQNDQETRGTSSHDNEPTGHSSQTVLNIEPNN